MISSQVSAMEDSHYQDLGEPCRAKQVLAGRVVVDRKDGRERFVLTNDNETHGCELIFIDPQKGTGKVYEAPAGAGSWALNEVPGDRLIVGTFYDGAFMTFDLKQMKFVQTSKFTGESYIWNLAMGGDGRVYGGTYPGGKLGALDLNTYAVEDCGAPTPPNQYLRVVSPMPDGRILCSFGMQKPTALIYSPAAKQFTPLPEQLVGASTGTVWNGYFIAGSRVYQGADLHLVSPPPFPVPPAEKGGWGVDDYITTPATLYLRQGNAIYRFSKGDSALTFIADLDLRGGRLLAGDSHGNVLGVRGQDYFVIHPGDTEIHLKPIPAEGRGRPILFLKADEHGRVWGGPHFGQTLFYYDPRHHKPVNTAAICDAGGEVYDVTFAGGKVYAASYAGGDITCYDPAAPWDQWNHKNPHPVVSVAPDYIRPTGGILTGEDGKLYSGWTAKYGTYGGLVAVTDPATGKTEKYENPLGPQAINAVAVSGNIAYIGTSLDANGLPPNPTGSPQFGVLDLASHTILFHTEFPGANSVDAVVFDRKTQRVAIAVKGKLHLFDARAQKLVEDLPGDIPRLTCRAVLAHSGGAIVVGSESSVLRVDLQSGAVTTLATLPSRVTNVAVAPGGSVFAVCESRLYRLQ
jgi:outer membrane protein assembly factor BamB